jgi:predicted RNase H-like nuclease (RuvC/YqgF family)
MNVNDELEKFRQRKAQEFFTKELPERLKGFEAALEGTPEEIERKLEDQKEIYILNFWNKLDELEEQKKKSLELAEKTAGISCENEEKLLASEIIAEQQEEIENLKAELQETKKKRDFWRSHANIQLRKLDTINFVIQLYSEKTINFLYGVARSSFQNQEEQEQEEENRWKDVY